MRRLLIAGLVFGCSATGAGPVARRDVARADAPDTKPGGAPAGAAATGQVIVFDRVPAGEFAVAAYHDENSNGKLDTGAFGRPTEGYGFSRDAKGNFGPPSFEDARLTLDAGQSERVVVRIRY